MVLKKSTVLLHLDSQWFSWYVAIFFYKWMSMNILLHSFVSFPSFSRDWVLQSVHICSVWGEGVLFKRVCLQKSQTFPDSQKMRENISGGRWQLLQTFDHQCYLYWTFRIWYEMKTTQIRKQIVSMFVWIFEDSSLKQGYKCLLKAKHKWAILLKETNSSLHFKQKTEK